MFSKSWQNWLTILLAILLAGLGISFFLGQQQQYTASNAVLWSTQTLAVLWTLWGQWRQRDVRWIKWSGYLLLGTIVVFAASGFYVGWQSVTFATEPLGASTQPATRTINYFGLGVRDTFALPRIWAIGVTGVWVLSIAFFAGIWLMRQLLLGGHPIIGVARTIVDEAIRMKIVLVLVIAVVLIVALTPLWINANERLEYRVQNFISISTSTAWILLAIMTIVLGCTSICSEIANRQIYLTMTKSIGKFEYLLGKWIGMCVINLWLVTVAGVGIYLSTQLLALQPARDKSDYDAVQDHILAARSSIAALPPNASALSDIAVDRFKDLLQAEPEKYGGAAGIDTNDRKQLAAVYNQLSPKLREGIQNFAVGQWQSVKPNALSVFWFRGVGNKAKEFSHENVQLRLKPRSAPLPPDELIRLRLWVNRVEYPNPIVIAQNTVFTVDIPLRLVDRNGDFELAFEIFDHRDPARTFPTTVTFPPGVGMELVFPVGTFEGNLFRAMFMVYVQLVFLSMLSLAAGTFLGFPVACLFCGMVLIIAVCAGFLGESLDSYASVPVAELSLWQRGVTLVKSLLDKTISGELWEAARLLIRLFGEAALIVNPNLSSHSPIDQITDGRIITNSQVLQCVLRVGIASTLVSGVVGWLIWRKREIARVIV